jgi:hypothetical protein
VPINDMDFTVAGTQDNGGVFRAFLGGAAALAVIAAAVVITLVGNAREPAPHMISSSQPNHPAAAAAPSLVHSASSTTVPTTSTTKPSTTTAALPPVPTTVPLPPPPVTVTTVAQTIPPATASLQPLPTVSLAGPTVVSSGGQFQWHSQVTGAVSGTWSGTVLGGEKGPGSTSRWSFPSGVFVWDNPSVRLEGGTYTITLTVYSRTGASASATAIVTYPRS